MLKVKRNFVRYISHEIRTPLNTVAMGIQHVQNCFRQVDGSITLSSAAEASAMLDEVYVSCNIAIDILNSILCYDRLENGDLQLSISVVSAKKLILETVRPFVIQVNQRLNDVHRILKVKFMIRLPIWVYQLNSKASSWPLNWIPACYP